MLDEHETAAVVRPFPDSVRESCGVSCQTAGHAASSGKARATDRNQEAAGHIADLDAFDLSACRELDVKVNREVEGFIRRLVSPGVWPANPPSGGPCVGRGEGALDGRRLESLAGLAGKALDGLRARPTAATDRIDAALLEEAP